MAVALLFFVGCPTVPAGQDGGGGGGGAATGGGSGGDEVTPVVHQPDAGCQQGFAACGAFCVDVSSDSRSCGACGRSCSDPDGGGFGYGCATGTCSLDGGGCANGTISCGSAACVDPRQDVDHCGSCFNRCSDRQVCVRGVCTAGQGEGTSCQSPLVLPTEGLYSFRFPSSLSGEHVFPCGPLTALPTRWFRFTASTTGNMTAEVTDSPDHYVVEVFSAATCDAPASAGCHDDAAGGAGYVTFAATAGRTYFVAVGLVGSWSGALPVLKLND